MKTCTAVTGLNCLARILLAGRLVQSSQACLACVADATEAQGGATGCPNWRMKCAECISLALSPFAVENPQRRSEEAFRRVDAAQVDCPSPPQIILQVFRRHPVEMVQPVFKAAVIGIDVLDVHGAPRPALSIEMDSFMADLRLP